jgi:hypothetical protein
MYSICKGREETAWIKGMLAGVVVTMGTIMLTGLLVIRWEVVT